MKRLVLSTAALLLTTSFAAASCGVGDTCDVGNGNGGHMQGITVVPGDTSSYSISGGSGLKGGGGHVEQHDNQGDGVLVYDFTGSGGGGVGGSGGHIVAFLSVSGVVYIDSTTSGRGNAP